MGMGVNRLWGAGPGDLWAVGDQGLILHHDGRRWTRVPSGSTEDLVAVAGRGPGDAWALGRNGDILRLQGGRWSVATRVPSGPSYDDELTDLLVLPSGEAWLVGGNRDRPREGQQLPDTCIVGHLRNQVWTFDRDTQDCGPLERVWAGRGPDDVWAQGQIAVVHWNGRYLTKNPRQRPPARSGLHGAPSGWRLIRSGRYGVNLERTGSGSAPVKRDARDFWAFGPDDVWAINGGTLDHFDGRAWVTGESRVAPHAVDARSPTDLWVLAGNPSDGGAQPSLLHFDGTRWATRPLPTDPRMQHVANHPCASARMMAVAAPPGGDVWALTSCNLWRFDGRRFTEVIPATPTQLSSLMVRSNDDVWVGGDKVLLHWNGKAVTSQPTSFTVEHLWGDARALWAGPPVQRWNGSAFAVPPELATDEIKKAQLTNGVIAGDTMWLFGGGLARWKAGHVDLVPVSGPVTAIRVSPAGELWLSNGTAILHGSATTSPAPREEDSAGLRSIFAFGGIGGLVWAVGENGILFKQER
jgi:hypothetical protein